MRNFSGHLLSTLATLTTALGCSSAPAPQTAPPADHGGDSRPTSPQAWTAADYGSDYRSTGLVPPKLISGNQSELATKTLQCPPPPDSAALIEIKCTIGVDGRRSKCRTGSVIARCENSFATFAQQMEKTFQYRPLLWNGQPQEVPYTYYFQIYGNGVRNAPMERSNRRPRDMSVRKDVQRLRPDDELRQIAGSPPSFHQGGGICVPPGTTALVRLSCIIGVDRTVSDCGPFPPVEPAGCGEAFANAITTIEETYRFRPVVRDGQPIAVHHDLTFQLLGEGVQPLRMSPAPK